MAATLTGGRTLHAGMCLEEEAEEEAEEEI